MLIERAMGNPRALRRPARQQFKSQRFDRDVDGILLLDKPLGLSSNAALQQARALFGARKAGHAGSLDPLASGLLPVCFGQATKVCGRLLNAGKTYQVRIALGARTESGDAETPIVERAAVPVLRPEDVAGVMARFTGEQQQIPPMYSALKHGGKRLYELARRGESVQRSARTIVIHHLRCIGLEPIGLEFEVRCSKGTYIRTLAADIAQALGTLGYVETLRRVSLEPFEGLPMYDLPQLQSLSLQERDAILLRPDRAFDDLPRLELTRSDEYQLLQGQAIHVADAPAAEELRAYGAEGRFVGLVSRGSDGRVRSRRLFVSLPQVSVARRGAELRKARAGSQERPDGGA